MDYTISTDDDDTLELDLPGSLLDTLSMDVHAFGTTEHSWSSSLDVHPAPSRRTSTDDDKENVPSSLSLPSHAHRAPLPKLSHARAQSLQERLNALPPLPAPSALKRSHTRSRSLQEHLGAPYPPPATRVSVRSRGGGVVVVSTPRKRVRPARARPPTESVVAEQMSITVQPPTPETVPPPPTTITPADPPRIPHSPSPSPLPTSTSFRSTLTTSSTSGRRRSVELSAEHSLEEGTWERDVSMRIIELALLRDPPASSPTTARGWAPGRIAKATRERLGRGREKEKVSRESSPPAAAARTTEYPRSVSAPLPGPSAAAYPELGARGRQTVRLVSEPMRARMRYEESFAAPAAPRRPPSILLPSSLSSTRPSSPAYVPSAHTPSLSNTHSNTHSRPPSSARSVSFTPSSAHPRSPSLSQSETPSRPGSRLSLRAIVEPRPDLQALPAAQLPPSTPRISSRPPSVRMLDAPLRRPLSPSLSLSQHSQHLDASDSARAWRRTFYLGLLFWPLLWVVVLRAAMGMGKRPCGKCACEGEREARRWWVRCAVGAGVEVGVCVGGVLLGLALGLSGV